MGKARITPGTDGVGVADGRWEDVLLVCRKCGGRLKKGGFGPKGRDRLPDMLRQMLRHLGRRREVGIVEVGCLGVCPKDAVVVLRGRDPGAMLVVRKGTEPAALADRLGLRPAKVPGVGADPAG